MSRIDDESALTVDLDARTQSPWSVGVPVWTPECVTQRRAQNMSTRGNV